MTNNNGTTRSGGQEQKEPLKTNGERVFEIRIPRFLSVIIDHKYSTIGVICLVLFFCLVFKVDVSVRSFDRVQQPSIISESTSVPSSAGNFLSLASKAVSVNNTESALDDKSLTSLSKVGISNTLKDTMKANQDKWAIDITQPPESARKEVYSRVSEMNGIRIGNVELPPAYVLFDPSCPHCKRMFGNAERLAGAAGVHFVFVPISVFLDRDTTVDLSLKLTTALRAGFSDLAEIAYTNMTKDNMLFLNDATWVYSHDDVVELAEQTLLFIQIGGGTPAVVWQKTDGSIGIVNGVPEAEDLQLE